ncbi:MAG TPA: response regulator transcription factor [Flavitalea sp.]|nr:response regulator transcription factor [Flavitalea sp.]
MKILIIEDEPELSKSIEAYLRSEQYICEIALDYASALKKIDLYEYDCVLLDITLPGGNGLSILKEIKANRKTEGIIIISAKDSIDDRINGLNLGADDYLPKPFHLSELSARIAAVLRRRKQDGNALIVFHEISVDTDAREIFVNKVPLELTRKEYQLLLYFLVNKGKVISKNALVQHLWGDEMGHSFNFDFIYTHIKNLRKKMQEAGSGDYLKAIYGMGYKFTDT